MAISWLKRTGIRVDIRILPSQSTNPHYKIERSHVCVTFTMEILMPGKTSSYWKGGSDQWPSRIFETLYITTQTDPVSTKEIILEPWWRHQMETFSSLLAICAENSPFTGEFPAQRPVTRSFDVFFDLRLNKQLSKQSWGWWFETPYRTLWRHCNGQQKKWF